MSDKVTPTITLAKLYENQNQNIDALVIYKNLYNENPTDELKTKIDELKDIIFKENTLEYSAITDKLFSEEEKRLFHILPHEQYQTYQESQSDLKNDETYPEELTGNKKEDVETEEIETEEIVDEIDEPLQPEDKDQIELEDPNEDELPIEKLDEIDEEELAPEENDIPDEQELEIKSEESTEIEPEPDIEEQIEDDISLDDDQILDNNKKSEIDSMIESDDPTTSYNDEFDPIENDDVTSIEDIVGEKSEEKVPDVDTAEDNDENELEIDNVNKSESEDEVNPEGETKTDNHILNLLTDLAKVRPDIVDRVLKENMGADATLADIKLSDLHYVVELLKVSENVEKD